MDVRNRAEAAPSICSKRVDQSYQHCPCGLLSRRLRAYVSDAGGRLQRQPLTAAHLLPWHAPRCRRLIRQ